MFGMMGTQWRFTKAVRELVVIAEEQGFLRPEMREQSIKGILEFSRDLKMASSRLGADEQAMITMMVSAGSMGPLAFDDAVAWCRAYAKRHGVADATVDRCKEAADGLAKKIGIGTPT